MRCLALLSLLLTLLRAAHAATIPALPPSACKTRAAVLRGPNALDQYLIRIEAPARCAEVGRLSRIITPQGGKLPPLGYFKLGDGAPLKHERWVFPGVRVEDREAPNVWKSVPIKGATW